MKTRPWTPSATPQFETPTGLPEHIGLHEVLTYSVVNAQPVEMRAISVLYLVLVAIRTGERFSVTRADGTEVCACTSEGVSAVKEFSDALFLMEKMATYEREDGIRIAMAELDARITAAEQARDQLRGVPDSSAPATDEAGRQPRQQGPRQGARR